MDLDAKELVQQGIMALQSGDKNTAHRLLRQAAILMPHNQNVWLWLCDALESGAEQYICLKRVVAIDPHSRVGQTAQKKLTHLALMASPGNGKTTEARYTPLMPGALSHSISPSTHEPPPHAFPLLPAEHSMPPALSSLSSFDQLTERPKERRVTPPKQSIRLKNLPFGSDVQLQLLWGYLLLITVAELLISFNPLLGEFLHIGLLVILFLHGFLGKNSAGNRLVLALTVVPLTRIVSLSLPLNQFPPITWYSVIGILMLVVTWLAIRHLEVSRTELKLCSSNILHQVMLAGGGLGLGMIEYTILHPSSPISDFSHESFFLAALILAVFTGFSEELMFRGLLQSVAQPVMPHWGNIYVALLFAVLHIGHGSLIDVFFVLTVGLLFAYIVQRSGSILGVTLTHGVTNVTLFLILPYLSQVASESATELFYSLLWSGTCFALIALVLCIFDSSGSKPTRQG